MSATFFSWKRGLCLLFPFFVLQAQLLAQTASTLQWRMSKDGQTKGYIYGTMHMGSTAILEWGDSVVPALSACKTLALELIVDNRNSLTLLSAMMADSAERLDRVLSKEDYALADSLWYKHQDTRLKDVRLYKPIILQSMVSQKRYSRFARSGVEKGLQQIADREDIKVIGLETIQEQMKALSGMPPAEQAQMLLKSLKELEDTTRNVYKELEKVYVRQELDELMTFINDTSSYPEEYMTGLITARNVVMSERLDSVLKKDGRVFCAVGAAHLPGPLGLLELMRHKGYVIEPVMPTHHLLRDVQTSQDSMPLLALGPFGLRWPKAFAPESKDLSVYDSTVPCRKSVIQHPLVNAKLLYLKPDLKALGVKLDEFCQDLIRSQTRLLSKAKDKLVLTKDKNVPGLFSWTWGIEPWTRLWVYKGHVLLLTGAAMESPRMKIEHLYQLIHQQPKLTTDQ